MKIKLFFVGVLVFSGCKTAQKGFFMPSTSLENIKTTPAVEVIIPPEIQYVSIDTTLKSIDIKQEILPIDSVAISPLKAEKENNYIIAKPINIIKKPLPKKVKTAYASLVFVLLSIFSMIIFGNPGTFTIFFGILMVILSFIFGIKAIKNFKKAKKR